MSYVDNKKFNYVLELSNVTKDFPGVKALDNFSLQLRPGEVLAICGENGAGKTTMINCMSGVFLPDQGEIKIDGVAIKMKNPQEAFSRGISVVHQERNLIPTFNVAENIFFNEICKSILGIVNKKDIIKKTKRLLSQIQIDLEPIDSIEGLSSGQKQMIEIARALSMNSHILILDEPTASISINETNILFETIRELRRNGNAIIFVSHKLEDIFAIADRVQVIRDGKAVGETLPITKLDRDLLIEMMVGSSEVKHSFANRDRSNQPVVLEAKEIVSSESINPASFRLHKGEILGWYGLVGTGRTELARGVIGINPISKGQININGKPVRINNYKIALNKHKIYYFSENRKEEGLFCTHNIISNISIVSLKKILNKAKLISHKKEKLIAIKYKDLLEIKTSSVENVVNSLSGGNQQKVCVAKCLITDPEIIIIDEPTVGIDIKTKREIHKLIYNLSQQGKTIVLITSDLPEMVQLADRILVFRDGVIACELVNTKSYDEMSSKILGSILKCENY